MTTIEESFAIWLDASKSVEQRVRSLLSEMTLAEKVGQMAILDGREPSERWQKWILEDHVGGLLSQMNEGADRIQAHANKTRLKIPALVAIDAIHGHSFCAGATIFPTQLAMACSWNTDMIRRVGAATADEVLVTGVQWTFSPVLCIARDLRWGRVDETFGEDPYLIGELGKGMIEGYAEHGSNIACCAKHFVAHSETQGGRDSCEAEISRRNLMMNFMPPFEKAARSGCDSFMVAYGSIDGLACNANAWLLRKKLREEWGFKGITVTDSRNIQWMVELMKVAEDLPEAVAHSVIAGVDMFMNRADFCEAALEAVDRGILPIDLIDEACARILTFKFNLGLFDRDLTVDRKKAAEVIYQQSHRELNYEMAAQSIVLLRNEKNLLPLGDARRKIGVFGPNADDTVEQLGDWSTGTGQGICANDDETHPRERVITVLDGIRANPDWDVQFALGCEMIETTVVSQELLGEAVATAQECDINIAVIGDTVAQTGERCDRANLDLSGSQLEMLTRLKATGKPLVVILINGKPLTIPWVAANADALIEAFNPGMVGGRVIAEILSGEINPSGKLPISFPHHVGQQPMYYNAMPGWHTTKYCDLPGAPLFAFGEGLSYTTYEYSDLKVTGCFDIAGPNVEVEVSVKNTGSRAGQEIAQLYVNDCVSSLVTPVKQLRGFRRIALEPGESKTMRFKLIAADFQHYDQAGEPLLESGTFDILVGKSSLERDLLTTTIRLF